MADIFISYAREDQARIRGLVSALEEQGWSIFWDRRIPAGKTWQSYIGRALSEAKCVIVAWSQHSITSEWVIEEANDGKKRGLLIPVLLDPVEPPLGFRGIQAADLTDWKPGPSSSYLDQLIQDIIGVVGVKPPQPKPEEELPAQTQPVATPGAVPTEPPPHEPTPPKPEPPKARLQEPKAIKPKPPELPKKRNNFLVGVMITMALVIVVGLAVWFSRQTKTRPVEPPVAKAPEAPPKASTQRTFTNSIGMSFVLIPAGSFTMGSPTNEPGREPGEKQHPVTISKPFYLQTTEVTQKQWKGVMGSNPSYFTDCGDCPVENVSWIDVQEFIKKLNQKESGARYRLPTEAEWEYACRAGSKFRFSFGDDEAKLAEYAWYSKNSGGKTHPVGKKKPNAWGLYDMHGNVWDWVQDCWHNNYNNAPDDGSAWLEKEGGDCGFRVIRGGSWYHGPGSVRASYRGRIYVGLRGTAVGFRLAQDIE